MSSRQGAWDETPSSVIAARLRASGVKVGRSVLFYGPPIVAKHSRSEVSIDDDSVTACSKSTRTALGVSHPVVLRTLKAGARLQIGKDTGISGGSICAATGITIGEGCLLGADCLTIETDFRQLSVERRRHSGVPEERRADEVTIGDGVFVGVRTIVLPDATIERGAVIEAGNTVRGAIPPGTVCAGAPARVLRAIS